MKLVIFGGGSSYTPELIHGLIKQHTALPVTEVCLVDINEQRIAILQSLSQRMFAKAGLPVTVSATTDRRRGLEGADFVNGLIRVGGMAARMAGGRVMGLVADQAAIAIALKEALGGLKGPLMKVAQILATVPDGAS